MKPLKLFALLGMSVFMVFANAKAQDSKATIRAAYDDLNKRDYAAFTKLVTPDFVEYAAGPGPVKTSQAAIEAYKMFFTAFPDLKFEIEDITAGTDGSYYLKTKITGTNTGSFGMLPPTGKKISVSDVDIIQLNAKGLATSHWSANPNGILAAVGYGSITNPATNVIMKGYELFGKNDIPSFLTLCADNVTFDVQDNVINTTHKMYKGKTGVTEFFTNLTAQNQYSVFQPWRFIADGDDVVVLVHAEFKHMPDGKMYNTNYVHHFTVIDGKITSFKGVADDQMPDGKETAENAIRSLFAVMDAGQTDKLPMYCAADFMISNPFLPAPAPIAAFQAVLLGQKAGFPDMKHHIDEINSDGHFVTTRGTFTGTNTGPMMGNPPTGNKVSVAFLVFDELNEAGKIKNRYVEFDGKAFEAQLMSAVK